MTKLNLRIIGENKTELSVNSIGTILFSYDTPVAAYTPDGVFKTSKKRSRTTSKHITQWLDGDVAIEREQEFFDNLINY